MSNSVYEPQDIAATEQSTVPSFELRPELPKKAQTAYFLFAASHRQVLKIENPCMCLMRSTGAQSCAVIPALVVLGQQALLPPSTQSWCLYTHGASCPLA